MNVDEPACTTVRFLPWLRREGVFRHLGSCQRDTSHLLPAVRPRGEVAVDVLAAGVVIAGIEQDGRARRGLHIGDHVVDVGLRPVTAEREHGHTQVPKPFLQLCDDADFLTPR